MAKSRWLRTQRVNRVLPLTLTVEASTREQTYQDINAVEGLIRNALHGDRRTEKQVKFENDEYNPGLIALDLSNCNLKANLTGLPPVNKLALNALVISNEKGRIYDLSKDPDFFNTRENTGNVIHFATRHFQMLLSTGRYRVRVLLIGMALKIVMQGPGVSAQGNAP